MTATLLLAAALCPCDAPGAPGTSPAEVAAPPDRWVLIRRHLKEMPGMSQDRLVRLIGRPDAEMLDGYRLLWGDPVTGNLLLVRFSKATGRVEKAMPVSLEGQRKDDMAGTLRRWAVRSHWRPIPPE